MPSGAAVRPAAGPRPGLVAHARQRTGAVVLGLVVAALAVLVPSVAASATTTTPATPDPSASTASTESIRVLVRNAGEPVEGIEFTVTQGETEIATGATDDAGQAEVPVPGPGDYAVAVDVESLPDGTSLINPDRNPATTTVNPLQRKPVAFQIVTGDAPAPDAGASSTAIGFDDLPQLLASGLRFGLIIALAAIGLSVIFGTTGLTNFAHGELITFGALIGVPDQRPDRAAVRDRRGPRRRARRVVRVPQRPARLAAAATARAPGLVAMMIVSIGLGLVLRYFFSLTKVFGTRSLFFNKYQGQQRHRPRRCSCCGPSTCSRWCWRPSSWWR